MTAGLSLMDAWWRWTWAPTPEEWQALWSLCTLVVAVVAAWLALHQLRAMKQTNEAAANANRAAADASRAADRPYVDVSFDFVPSFPKDPDAVPEAGLTGIAIENRGRSAARDVQLYATPPLRASDKVRPQDKNGEIFAELLEKFTGDYVYSRISPGQRFSYILDRTKEQLDPANNLPQRYEIRVTYTDPDGLTRYEDNHVLDLHPWKLARIDADPIAVIAKQIRTMNSYEKTAQKQTTALIRAIEDLRQQRE